MLDTGASRPLRVERGREVERKCPVTSLCETLVSCDLCVHSDPGIFFSSGMIEDMGNTHVYRE